MLPTVNRKGEGSIPSAHAMTFDNKKNKWFFSNFAIEVFLEPFDGQPIFKIIPVDGKYDNTMMLTIDDDVEDIQKALDFYKKLEEEQKPFPRTKRRESRGSRK